MPPDSEQLEPTVVDPAPGAEQTPPAARPAEPATPPAATPPAPKGSEFLIQTADADGVPRVFDLRKAEDRDYIKTNFPKITGFEKAIENAKKKGAQAALDDIREAKKTGKDHPFLKEITTETQVTPAFSVAEIDAVLEDADFKADVDSGSPAAVKAAEALKKAKDKLGRVTQEYGALVAELENRGSESETPSERSESIVEAMETNTLATTGQELLVDPDVRQFAIMTDQVNKGVGDPTVGMAKLLTIYAERIERGQLPKTADFKKDFLKPAMEKAGLAAKPAAEQPKPPTVARPAPPVSAGGPGGHVPSGEPEKSTREMSDEEFSARVTLPFTGRKPSTADLMGPGGVDGLNRRAAAYGMKLPGQG